MIIGGLALTITFYALLLGGVFLFLDKIIFRPSPLDRDHEYTFDADFKEVFLLDDEQGLHINALYFPKPNGKGCILYFHGNSGSLERWGDVANDFIRRGYSAFIIDYPGYGKSEGKPSEEMLIKSAEIAYKWVKGRYDPANIIIYGRSIGSAPASFIAAHYDAGQIILETPFYSMDQLLKKRAPIIFRAIPIKYPLRVHDFLEKTTIPVTIFHGTHDRIVPLSSAERLKPHLKPKDRFITIPNGRHNNLRTFGEYQNTLDQIFRRKALSD